MRVKPAYTQELQTRTVELEEKIKKLERQSKKLEEKLEDCETYFSQLVIKFGHKIRERVDEQIDKKMDEVEYRILKKLVDGDMFELKMKDKDKK